MRLFSAIFVAAMLAASSFASAQATRTWVSGVGDDVNPCSRTAPCKTFPGAISKTAAGGEIDVLDPGGFGTVTITKSITIDGGGTFASILASGTNGININAGVTDSTILRNMSINGAGAVLGLNGVNFLAGLVVNLENLTIMDFSHSGVSVAPSTSGAHISIRNVRIDCNGSAGTTGILISTANSAGALSATLDHVQVVNCATALSVVVPAGKPGITVLARDSEFSNSATAGVAVVTSTGTAAATVTLDHTMLTQNGTGASVTGATSTLRLTDSSVLDNTTGLSSASGAAIISFNNNRLKGNTTDGSPTQNIYQH